MNLDDLPEEERECASECERRGYSYPVLRRFCAKLIALALREKEIKSTPNIITLKKRGRKSK
ncbi:MAG: hypothetical protein IJW33_07350 [Lentisphaeria bacterium]|nr:hypothetical protein [Lentisphaeria bacterium]MBQ9787966.1 hypothetical protein [Lentisphaeria bacterium]